MRRLARSAVLVAGTGLLLLGVAWEAGSWAGAELSAYRFPESMRNPPRSWGVQHFGIPPQGTGQGPLRVAFLGDVQRGIADVARSLGRIGDFDGVDLTVQHGDLVSHGEAPYYGLVAKAIQRVGVPSRYCYVVPGNHDIEPDGVRAMGWDSGRALFEDRLGPRWWAVVLAPDRGPRVLLVGLDDSVEPPSGEQLGWLDTVLHLEKSVPWLVVIHKPPRRVDQPGAPALTGMEPLIERLERRPPLAVVSGHLHQDHDVTVNGVRYVVNAHGGDLDGGLFREPRPASLLVVDLDPSKPLEFRRVPLERETWWAVRLDQLWVRLWAERRRAPWGPWALLGIGAVLLVVAFRRRRAHASATVPPD